MTDTNINKTAGADKATNPAADDFFTAGEAVATGETYRMTPEELARRKKRNWAILGMCFAFIILVYSITVTRIADGIEQGREENGGPVFVK